MPNDTSLMAHLIPTLTPQVENAATEALAYILNRSEGSMQALNDLLREGGLPMQPIVRVGTQVSYPDGSRPDMAGYDKDGAVRLLVEAKFWAALLGGQASWYARLLDQPGPATLLFISPEVRIPTLWAEIERQMEKQDTLDRIDSASGVRRARVIWSEPSDTDLQLVLISWVRLLDKMDALAADDIVKSDIKQLRGLARQQGDQLFLPIRSDELSPSLARRVVWYRRLVDDAVDARGVSEGWMDTKGLRATPQWYGYGRWIHFSGVENTFWFGVNHERWSGDGDTPLWLSVSYRDRVSMDEIGKELRVRTYNEWIPIHLKTGVDYDKVLKDVVVQLKRIREIALADLNSRPSYPGDEKFTP